MVIVAKTFGYDPPEIKVPARKKIIFKVASADVSHSFSIVNTNVNMMVIPGQINTKEYTFDKPGQYLVICNEYRGTGHHFMKTSNRGDGVMKQISIGDQKLALTNIVFAYIAFLIGTFCGLLQVFIRNDALTLPSWLDYYQVLTAHGVLLALIFTTYFIFGFLISGMSYSLGAFGPKVRLVSWIGFIITTAGTLLAIIEILAGRASVLYTFFAPLQASGWYYVGLALFVFGTWIYSFALIGHYVKWKKQHKKQLSPLFAFMTISTLILWLIACLGVVATVLFQFIPWAYFLEEEKG